MKLHDSIDEFILEQRCRGHSPHTIAYYDRILRWFSEFAAVRELQDVDQISLTVCKHFYLSLAERGLSSVSIQTYVRGFRAYVEWLYESDYLSEDLCRRFKLPKATRRVIDILTDEELQSLFRCFDTSTFPGLRDYAVCTLMFDSGLRLHEVVTLECKHVHLDECYMLISGKGDRERIVPFGDNTARTLRTYLEERRSWCPPIASFFVTVDGEPISDDTLKDVFRKLKYRSGIARLHPHLLRHTFATKYLSNGGDIYTLQRILGHSSLDMVKRYLHLSNQLLINSYTSPNDVFRNKNSPRRS